MKNDTNVTTKINRSEMPRLQLVSRMRFARLLLSFFILISLGLVGCSSVNSPQYDHNGNEEGPRDEGIAPAVFPHPDHWSDRNIHGKYVIDFGIDKCANACHGENFEGGSARSCYPCHQDGLFPHSDQYAGLLGHGKDAKEQGVEKCQACHSEDLQGGYDPHGKKNCNRCHTSYPQKHQPIGEWRDKKHGQEIRSLGSYNECTTMCHRPGIANANLRATSCTSHHPYPGEHTRADWSGEGHGDSVLGDDDAPESCTTCHGDILVHRREFYPAALNAQQRRALEKVVDPTRAEANQLKRCYGCHFPYPHETAISPANGRVVPWKTAHYESIMVNWGDPSETCAKNDACHAPLSRRSTNPVRNSRGRNENINQAFCNNYCHQAGR